MEISMRKLLSLALVLSFTSNAFAVDAAPTKPADKMGPGLTIATMFKSCGADPAMLILAEIMIGGAGIPAEALTEGIMTLIVGRAETLRQIRASKDSFMQGRTTKENLQWLLEVDTKGTAKLVKECEKASLHLLEIMKENGKAAAKF
jgi:hypothetical protein